jgi:retron-type reverse transcriptase
MKRRNYLFEEIIDYQNIRLAFIKAIRGKRSSSEVLLFCRNIDANLDVIRKRLLQELVQWGDYHSFTITDPKERVISAAPIADRIIHHAIMNVLEPVFERQMIYHSYACRKNKGTHAAVKYAFSRGKASPWFLKLDIRKYFDSIDHAVLKAHIRRLIKDKKVLSLLDSVIDSYEKTPGTGVPIGNLTSQFFANLYLSRIDHYILEQLKPSAYVRYMDDFVLWSGDKKELQAMLDKIRLFTTEHLNVQLKQPILAKTDQGLPFLGFLLKPGGIYLLRKSKQRMIKRIREIKRDLASRSISEGMAVARVVSVYAAVLLARTRPFRVKLWYGNGFGHEPGDTGWQLEQ